MAKYTEDFKRRVKEAFPDWQNMHALLDSNNPYVGRYLDDNRGFDVAPEEVVTAIESGNTEKLLKHAKRSVEIDKLYSEFYDQPEVAAHFGR